MRLLGGLLLAFLSAVTINLGFFAQHRASNTLPALSARHPWSALKVLFTDGRWLLGYVVGLAGWGLYVAALLYAPISLVQAVSAGGLGLLALFVWRVAHLRFSGREQAAIAASTTGVVLLCISFVAGAPRPATIATHTVAIWIGCMVVAAGMSWRPGSLFMRPGAGLGTAAGLCFAAGDVSTKAFVSGRGLLFVPVLVVSLVLGFVALQLAFRARQRSRHGGIGEPVEQRPAHRRRHRGVPRAAAAGSIRRAPRRRLRHGGVGRNGAGQAGAAGHPGRGRRIGDPQNPRDAAGLSRLGIRSPGRRLAPLSCSGVPRPAPARAGESGRRTRRSSARRT